MLAGREHPVLPQQVEIEHGLPHPILHEDEGDQKHDREDERDDGPGAAPTPKWREGQGDEQSGQTCSK